MRAMREEPTVAPSEQVTVAPSEQLTVAPSEVGDEEEEAKEEDDEEEEEDEEEEDEEEEVSESIPVFEHGRFRSTQYRRAHGAARGFENLPGNSSF